MKLKSKVLNGQRSSSSSAKTKLLCLSNELKHCMVTESLKEVYYASHKLTDVAVKS